MMTAAIVLAGGSGSRARIDINKVYLPIRGRPMLAYSLDTMDKSDAVDVIVLVVREVDREQAELLVQQNEVGTPTMIVVGGRTRQASEYEGLTALADRIESGEIDCVVIHDGARPFMSAKLLERVIARARRDGGAIPGYVPEEPLYETQDGLIVSLAEGDLRKVQTPQGFHALPLLQAYRRAKRAGFEGVDTAETVERFSDLPIRVVAGDPRNIKVTYVEDIFVAEDLAYDWQRDRGDA
ncbi:MAG TPA: 2-C-methyl-D-erythritol 4-phosphate cytidylyltransferase [Actinobacteria bacterium]|nr:2-C-methyl-D-erythritol 4-phosphate cytidylyltransferase [bacterium BMS3Bbin01]HDH26315.1 2-C-methyl-D-erythritol 4-phosphate cytidylyltransferase [Actinomycetota bacterium]